MSGQQFRDGFYLFAPPWLSTGNAERYLYTLELMRDFLCEKANEAIKIRMPGQGDESQLPFLAHDRQLVQGPNEPPVSFAARLTQAFQTWSEAGSAIAALGQLQAYAQGFQFGANRQFAIVSNQRTLQDGAHVNTWWIQKVSDPVGKPALLSTVPANYNWDGNLAETWRCWLVIYQWTVDLLSGASAATSSAGGGSFVEDDWGQIVAGVWVAQTSGTPLNAPFITVTGLLGLSGVANVGDTLTLSGSGNASNNGTWQIVQIVSDTSCVIANPLGVAPDAGPMAWTIRRYPWMPPALAWGSPGQVWGQGETILPPEDTGSNVNGTWRPTTQPGAGATPTYAWGVRASSLTIQSIRSILSAWKSAGTYYPNIIIAYDGQSGAYDRMSTPGSGNPDGTFGDLGELIAGVWTASRLISSPWDAYCQGTGQALACSVENVT